MPVTVSEWAVEASGVVKRFGSATAVDNVDLRVRVGSVHGLLGPNGAGKTTLLRMLFGLVRPTSGELRLFGRTHRSSWSAGGNHALDGVAGFVESPRFYGYLSGYRSLEMLAAYDGNASATSIEAAIASVGLTERAHEKTARYSLGMRQRLGIAAALLRSPRLLVLDEPANGLDPAGARDMRALIRSLADAGLTVLMSSHVMSDVEALCDEVTILRTGAVAFSGSVEDLRVRAPVPTYRMDTSDNARAEAMAPAALRILPHPDGGLDVGAQRHDLDAYVISLGRAGIAVRSLSLETTPLEALFFGLTDSDPRESASDSRSQLVQAAP
jgi:ABC-2 type transport system ATP-binding protein